VKISFNTYTAHQFETKVESTCSSCDERSTTTHAWTSPGTEAVASHDQGQAPAHTEAISPGSQLPSKLPPGRLHGCVVPCAGEERRHIPWQLDLGVMGSM